MSDLPLKEQASEQKTVQFFDNYYSAKLEFPSNEFDAVVGFFLKKQFQKIAAVSVAQVLLNQAKVDNVTIFSILDTLKGLDKANLSFIVTKIINANRDKTSKLGYIRSKKNNSNESRNIYI